MRNCGLTIFRQLVAKLKAIFDRFDIDKYGRLNGDQVEQVLLYMNRSVETDKAKAWINNMKIKEKEIEFAEFVAEYSAVVAGDDPGERPASHCCLSTDPLVDVEDPSKERARSPRSLSPRSRSPRSPRRKREDRFNSDSDSDREHVRRKPEDIESSGDVLSIKLVSHQSLLCECTNRRCSWRS